MFTRLSLGTTDGMANADHLVGALVLTTVSLAAAEVARSLRFLLIPLGMALFATPFVYGATPAQLSSSLVCGALLILLSLHRGPVRNTYGGWERHIV
jgi:hypothetical protein